MRALLGKIKKILKETNEFLFSTNVFQIIGKCTDEFTHRSSYTIKIKRIATSITLTTDKIMQNDLYFTGLSEKDRLEIINQFVHEIKKPMAFLEEIPVHKNKNDEYIFKIFLISEKKIVCGTARYFIKNNEEIFSLLNQKDAAILGMHYYQELFEKNTDSDNPITKKHSKLFK